MRQNCPSTRSRSLRTFDSARARPSRSRMEAAGIEPASRDVSVPASTCVVAELLLAGVDARRQASAPASPTVSRRCGNRATPHRHSPLPRRTGRRGQRPGTGRLFRRPLPSCDWQLWLSQVFNEASWNLGTRPKGPGPEGPNASTPQLVRSNPVRPRMSIGLCPCIISADPAGAKRDLPTRPAWRSRRCGEAGPPGRRGRPA